MSYSRFAQFLYAHRSFQIIYLALCWIANYYGIFWCVAWLKPEWATETFDFWLGLGCLVWCLIGCITLACWWRLQDSLELRNDNRNLTENPE